MHSHNCFALLVKQSYLHGFVCLFIYPPLSENYSLEEKVYDNVLCGCLLIIIACLKPVASHLMVWP